MAETFSPSRLPSIDVVEVQAIPRRHPPVAVHCVTAVMVAELWRQLPPGRQARCHNPGYALNFHSGSLVVCTATLCWECNNIHGEANGEVFVYEFDARHEVSQALLAELGRIVSGRR